MTIPAPAHAEGFWPRVRAAVGLLLMSIRDGLLGTIGVLASGLLLNWGFVLWTLRLSAGADGSVLLRAAGSGVIVLVFGVLIPIGYLLISKQVGAQAVARRLYARNRDEIIGWLTRAAREGVAKEPNPRAVTATDTQGDAPRSPERLVSALAARLSAAPRPVAAVVRMLVRRHRFAALLPALGSFAAEEGQAGPPLRGAIVMQVDALVSASLTTARTTFRRALVANMVVVGILALAFALT